MNQRQKNKLIDNINEAFVNFLKEWRGRRYSEVVRKINADIIDNIDNINASKVRDIVDKYTSEIKIEDVAIFTMLLSGITAIINKPRERRDELLAIIGVMSLFSIANTDMFVKKIYKSMHSPESENEKKAGVLLSGYVKKNQALVDKITKSQVKMFNVSQYKAKIQMSRDMIKEVKVMTAEGKPLEMQRHWLKRNYNNNKIINRALNTEIHAGIEKGKHIEAVELGFTHKIWKTQEDDRVRVTRWHNAVANKRIEIDADFTLGGIKALAPADERLPAGERINCRCYLIYD